MANDETLSLEGGKYQLISSPDGSFRCERYGLPWRDLAGDKLVLTLFSEVNALRAQLATSGAAVKNGQANIDDVIDAVGPVDVYLQARAVCAEQLPKEIEELLTPGYAVRLEENGEDQDFHDEIWIDRGDASVYIGCRADANYISSSLAEHKDDFFDAMMAASKISTMNDLPSHLQKIADRFTALYDITGEKRVASVERTALPRATMG